MSILLSLPNDLNSTIVGDIKRYQTHERCKPIHIEQYKYTSPAYRKRYKTYESILHPISEQLERKIQKPLKIDMPRNKFYNTLGICYCNKERNHNIKNNKKQNLKKQTVKDINARIERQTLRYLRTRIDIPPRIIDIQYCKVVLDNKPVIQFKDETTQLTTCDQAERNEKFDSCEGYYLEEDKRIRRPFHPAGVNIDTQIYPDDLFKFDDEVGPLTELITQKVTHQGKIEVKYEDHINKLKQKQRTLLDNKDERNFYENNIVDNQKHEEKVINAIIDEQRVKNSIEKDLQNKISANVLSRKIIGELLPLVLDDLQNLCYNINEIADEIRTSIMETLKNDINEEYKIDQTTQILLNELIKQEIQQRYDYYRNPPEHTIEKIEIGSEDGEVEEEEEEEEEEEDNTIINGKRVRIDSNIQIFNSTSNRQNNNQDKY